jgi:glycosyltransferase involved in cell wall biosynthesis
MISSPKISIITPSFNQCLFLERTILSVLSQDYLNIEYIIIDGGSTDGSVDIIRRYEHKLAYWVSEPDKGQVDAINKGFRFATGEWVGWQNSDDFFYPGAIRGMVDAANKYPQAELIMGDMMLVDVFGRPIRDIRYTKPTYNGLRAEGMLIANQSAFWKRDLHNLLGLLDDSYHCSFDYEWFLRVVKNAECVHIPEIWGALRLHGETKTCTQAQRFQAENQRILIGREMPAWRKQLYKLRRMALMLGTGQLGYVLRGISRRIGRHNGELF